MFTKKSRFKVWPLWIFVLLFAGVLALGRPRRAPGTLLELSKNAGEVAVLRNRAGELMLFNFRPVEPHVLYRSSGFPVNKKIVENGKTKKRPAAYGDDQLFQFLQKRGIHTVVTLQETESFWAEQGYFEWWEKRTGNKIEVVSLPIKIGHAYNRDSSGAVRAAAKFLAFMKKRKPEDGAVLVHCDAGKDRTGVVIAAYELWRNEGKMDRDELWQRVRARYLESNNAIRSDKEAGAWAGETKMCNDCGDGKVGAGWVCGEWLDKLRPDLELLAQL